MAKPSSPDASAAPAIELTSLNINQLQNLKQSLDEELQQLTQSYAALRQAHMKFAENETTLNLLSRDANGKPMLVPLTSSLYVPGEVASPESVIVDVGTGYFVEKSIADAKSYYSKKSTFVKVQLDKLGETINSRQAAARGENTLSESELGGDAPMFPERLPCVETADDIALELGSGGGGAALGGGGGCAAAVVVRGGGDAEERIEEKVEEITRAEEEAADEERTDVVAVVAIGSVELEFAIVTIWQMS
ncbi:subunit of tubulin prefoldin [Gonapodya sp. JEL0774]|nr:subunit of tubulin prefoldin [Gonapodya sp. JEL0774]